MGPDSLAANAALVEDESDTSPLLGLGSRIRELRQDRGLTLTELSQKSQVSVAMLSHIERGQASPSIKTLDRIRLALDVPLASFFLSASATDATRRPVAVRKSERPKLELRHLGLRKELLSPSGASELEMLMLVMAPGGGSGAEPWARSGEKGGMVIAGEFELTVGRQRHVLSEGDSFQFDSSQPHWFRNLSDSETRVLWIINPCDLG